MLRLSLTVWRGKQTSLQVVLMQSVTPVGITKYRCEIHDEGLDHVNSQENETKQYILDHDIIKKVQHLLSDIKITAAPQAVDGSSDGVNHILKIENIYQSATYMWCQQLPKGWERLEELASLMSGLARCLPE